MTASHAKAVCLLTSALGRNTWSPGISPRSLPLEVSVEPPLLVELAVVVVGGSLETGAGVGPTAAGRGGEGRRGEESL